METYDGCSDGNCILRETPLLVHTNGGCRCLRDIEPTARRLAITRRIRGQQAKIARLEHQLEVQAETLDKMIERKGQQQAEIEWLRAEATDLCHCGTCHREWIGDNPEDNPCPFCEIERLREGLTLIVRRVPGSYEAEIARAVLAEGQQTTDRG